MRGFFLIFSDHGWILWMNYINFQESESESNGNNFYLYSHFMISTRDEVYYYSSGLFGSLTKTLIVQLLFGILWNFKY